MRYLVRLAFVAAFASYAAGPVSLSAADGRDKPSGPYHPWGTWIVRLHLPWGGELPMLATLTREGTTICSSSSMYGGVPGFPPTLGSAVHEVWERTGPKTIATTSVNMLFHPATDPTAPGQLFGFVRSRSELRFDGDGDHLVGEMSNEFLECPTPLTCPDITDPGAHWAPRLKAIPMTAVRLRRVER